MREILFRGKRIDTGAWVEGGFFEWLKSANIVANNIDSRAQTPWEVDPETVGQYTGLTDRNGTKIFEGDILQTRMIGYKGEKKHRFVVKYGEYLPKEYCRSIYSQYTTIGFYCSNGKGEYQLSTCSDCFEVIGNVHDNPELLEGAGTE